jgi:LysM repeat protein
MILYQNRKIVALLLGLFLLQGFLGAQETVPVDRTNNKVILEGKVYYIHTVKPGQTLYGISRAYNISQKAIAIENPGVISGLQVGQALKIPADGPVQEEIDTSDLAEPGDPVKYHRVRPGETLYRISRLYELKEDDIIRANPGVTAENLQPGQNLRIPDKLELEEEHPFNEEGLLYHKVKRKETLYSIAAYYQVSLDEIRAENPELGWGGPKAGQIIRIPAPQLVEQEEAGEEETEAYEYDELDSRHENIRRTYRVAFFIPFDFREMEPLDSLIKDVKSETRKNRIIERYMMEERQPQAVQFLEFFQGSLLAIESLKQTGMRLEVRYFDTRRSMDRTRDILRDDELEDYDLFIGPFHTYNLELVSTFSRRHRIPVVTPFYDELDLVRSNPYLFQMSPSLEKGYKEAAKLVASKHMYNIVYVRQQDSLNLEKHDYFKQAIFDGFDDYAPADPVRFKEVIMDIKDTEKIIHSLTSDRKNLIVVPTGDEALASTLMSTLFYQQQYYDYDIEVIGGPHWPEFSTIKFEYYHKLNLVFYSSFWVDYHDQEVEEFMATYRKHYYNEPIITSKKGINYGILGHDMTLYFLNALRTHGRRFILELDDYHPRLVQGPYTFSRISGSGGYENSNIAFYQFLPDMSIQEFSVPPLPQRDFFFRPVEDQGRRKFLYREDVFN